MRDTLSQLNKQVSVLFSDTKHESVLGIIAVGKCWKCYQYHRSKNKESHERRGSWDNDSYTGEKDTTTKKNFVITNKSTSDNSLDDDYDKKFAPIADQIMKGL